VGLVTFCRRAAALSLAFVLSVFLCATNATPATRGVAFWPQKKIKFVLCSTSLEDRSDRRKCDQLRYKLSPRLTKLVRDAVGEWNGIFAGHLEFQEVETFERSTLRIAGTAPDDRGACGVSDLGYTEGANPTMVIGEQCANQPRTKIGSVLHELGHIAGLHHEQRRPDRDQYITLTRSALQSYALSKHCDWKQKETCQPKIWARQYTKLCDLYLPGPCSLDFELTSSIWTPFEPEYGSAYGPYDFASIMIYSMIPPGREGAKGIVDVTPLGAARLAEQRMNRSQVGQRDALSAGDIAAIKHFYPNN